MAASTQSDGVTASERSELVKAHAREVGFDLVGIAPTGVPRDFGRYREAMARGYGAGMEWLWSDPELRRDAACVHASARSVVALGVDYWTEAPGYLEEPPAVDQGWIARYAQGKDYHAHIRKMLIRLVRRLAADDKLGFPSQRHRIFVDTGPVLERAFAQRAGLGWVGKNTMLINPDLGSWVFLAVVLTPLELEPDEAIADRCGRCTRCLDVCPTGAFPGPYTLDARRCIATWTIESPEPAAVIEPDKIGQHVFGCDLCQEVCPWNARTGQTRHAPLRPRPENVRPALDSLVGLDDEEFKERFPRSAVRRVDARQLESVVRTIKNRGR